MLKSRRSFPEGVTKTIVFSNVTLAVSLLYFALFLGYVQVNYSHIVLRDPFPAALFYIAPAVCIVLLLLSIKLSAKSRVNLSLLIVSTAICIFLAEGYLTLFPGPTAAELRTMRKVSAADELGIDFDTRSKLQVVDELTAAGQDVTLGFLPHVYLSDALDSPDASGRLIPLGGRANTASVLCNEAGNYLVYDSDERGFNNPRGTWSEVRLDLLLVGDSYTQGICVAPENNIAGRLREVHPRTLNLGMSGNGPLMMLATLKEYAHLFEPKVVLWLFYGGNDLLDLAEERRTPLLNYLEEEFSQDLPDKQQAIDELVERYMEEAIATERTTARESAHEPRPSFSLWESLKLARLRSLAGLTYDDEWLFSAPEGKTFPDITVQWSKDADDAELQLFARILGEADRFVDSWGGQLYFVSLPEYLEFTRGPTSFQSYSEVMSIVADLGIPLIDLRETFREHADPFSLFPLRLPAHYNESGYALVAETILEQIGG